MSAFQLLDNALSSLVSLELLIISNWRFFFDYQVGEDEVDGWKRRVVTLVTEVGSRLCALF